MAEMDMQSYHPFQHSPKSDGAGVTTLRHLGTWIVVDVVTYVGGQHGTPFTRIETYFAGERHMACLPKHYHEKWLGRLARQFEAKVMDRAKCRGYL